MGDDTSTQSTSCIDLDETSTYRCNYDGERVMKKIK